MNIKAIIYDFDGVICDSVNVKTEAFALMYQPYGEDIVKEVVRYHLEHGGVSRFEKFKYWHRNLLGQEIDESQIAELSETFTQLVLEKVIHSDYIPGALPFIQQNYGRYLQFICTGTPDYEIKKITDERGITNYFDRICGSPKTKVEIVKELLVDYSLSPEEVVFFGDASTDYYAAVSTKTHFIGVGKELDFLPTEQHRINDFIEISSEKTIFDDLF